MRRRLNIHHLEIDKPEWAATLHAIDAHPQDEREEWWKAGEDMDESSVIAFVRESLQHLAMGAVT